MTEKDNKNKKAENKVADNAAPKEHDQETQAEANQELEQLRKEKADLFSQLQRVSADYSNFQKRVPRQISDSVAYEKETLIRSLLPALDNFEHALEKGRSAESASSVLEGVKIVYDQLLGILKSHGVEPIQALGQTFDPTLHAALMQRADATKEENIILDDFAKGYTLNGRVIRPSRVAVNKTAAPQSQPAKPSEKDGQLDSSGEDTTDTE